MSTDTAHPISTDARKRRGQAIAGAVAGVAVIGVLTAVFFGVRAGGPDDAPTAAAAPVASAAPAPSAAEAPPSAAEVPPSAAAPAPGGVETPPALTKQPQVKAGTGKVSKLTVTELIKGTGPVVQAGQTVTANYVLVSYQTGQVVDSSWSRGEPFSTPIGAGRVIQGWDQGIPGQKVGSRIQLDVPAALAYGEAQGDLRFVVDILAAR